MAIKYHEHSLFLSCDDKARIEVGEPGFAISSGVRGKKSIVPATSYLGALDHDVNQKGTITPSVVMCCDIPANITESFYRGEVFVGLKDSVFQASSSFRTVLETIHTLKNTPGKLAQVKNIFMITNGGPENRVNFDSVKIPLLLMFKELELDMFVAIWTAPGHSYVNPVERIMSILNIGFQNIALERASSESNETIKKCKNLEDLRKHPEIRDD